MMPSTGSVIGGIFLICLAGIFNGSWNAAFAPNANLAVGKTSETNDSTNGGKPAYDLSHEHAFALFQLYAAIINIPICIFWAGGLERVSAIISETPPMSILLVVIFSLIWGLGTLLFGIAGVGMGTNLSMGLIAILGAFLPLLTEKTLNSPFGAMICVGLAICCVGLWLATKALALRDNDEKSTASVQEYNKEINCPRDLEDEISELSFEDDEESKQSEERAHIEYTTVQKVLICVATGVTAVQLQFAFVFGSPITALATGEYKDIEIPGETPYGGDAAIIWLLAISIGAPIAIVNGLWKSPIPLSHSLRAPWWRHVRLIVTTSLPWIAHIHIYGLSATKLFPKRIAASITWPLLMMITNLWALVLSYLLGEWKNACKHTKQTFMLSLSVTMGGLVVLMSSVAVPVPDSN